MDHGPVGLLHCGRDRRHRRQRGRARRRRRRRGAGQDPAGGGDRARVERPGRGLSHPRRGALLALLIEPLSLGFRVVEIVTLAGSVVVATALLADGRSSRLKVLADRGLRRGRGRLLPRRRPVAVR